MGPLPYGLGAWLSAMKHWVDNDNAVHCEGASGTDFTLCGLAPEGECPPGVRADACMRLTDAKITCEACIGVIAFCRKVRPGEVALPFERRGR